MIIKKLYISLIFRILVATKLLIIINSMYNFYAIFVRFLDICKQLSDNWVNESSNIPTHYRENQRIDNPKYMNKLNGRPIGRIKYALI